MSFCSNIDSKSSNNTFLNIIEILLLLLFFQFPVSITEKLFKARTEARIIPKLPLLHTTQIKIEI